MRKGFTLLILAAFVVAAAWSPAPASAQEAMKVGIILPFSGEKAKFGEIEKKSFEMAMEEINGAGGVTGKKLEFIFEDDTGRPDVARSAAEKLITRDKVLMLGGGYGSSETFAIGRGGPAEQASFPGQYGFR